MLELKFYTERKVNRIEKDNAFIFRQHKPNYDKINLKNKFWRNNVCCEMKGKT